MDDTEIPIKIPITFGIEGVSCGYDFGEAETHKYNAPFKFTGTVQRALVDLSGELIVDEKSMIKRLLDQ